MQINVTSSVVISTKNCLRKLATVSSLKFPCCRLVTNAQYQRDATSSRVMNHVIATNQPLHWLRLLYDITSEKLRILFVQTAMSKNRTILSFDQRIEVLCRLGEAHHVERLLPSQCGKMQMARRPSMLSKQTGKVIVAYVKYKYSRTVGLHYISCYDALILGLLTIEYIIMTVRVFIRNIAGGDSSMLYCNTCVLYLASPACPSVPVTSGHLQCTDTFAWSRVCPFMTGTTVHLESCK